MHFVRLEYGKSHIQTWKQFSEVPCISKEPPFFISENTHTQTDIFTCTWIIILQNFTVERVSVIKKVATLYSYNLEVNACIYKIQWIVLTYIWHGHLNNMCDLSWNDNSSVIWSEDKSISPFIELLFSMECRRSFYEELN